MKGIQPGVPVHIAVLSSIVSLTFACAYCRSGIEFESLHSSDTPERGYYYQKHEHKKWQELKSEIFKVVWNVPRNQCQSKFGVDLHLDTYSIHANPTGTIWNGDAITIFYNDALGLYPFYEGNAETGSKIKINAGLPQLTNLTEHYEKATNDIIAAIPNPDFSGLAVIDWEKWFPQWDFPDLVMDYYHDPSKELVRQQHPDWENDTIGLVAKLEYEQAAKALMEGTLLLGQRLRPKGVWGYYHHPYCRNKNNVGSCEDETKKCNDDIPWLFHQSTAFYPSIYIKSVTKNVSRFVQARLGEALRIREAYGNPKEQPIFSYCRFNYSHTNLYYNLNTLNKTILQSAEAGLEGAVIWGDHNDTSSIEACQQLQSYIRSALGPTVALTSEAAANCSLRLCSGNGRCQGKILQCKKRKHNLSNRSKDGKPFLSNLKTKTDISYMNNVYMDTKRGFQRKPGVIDEETCLCQCFVGWSGGACDKPSGDEALTQVLSNGI